MPCMVLKPHIFYIFFLVNNYGLDVTMALWITTSKRGCILCNEEEYILASSKTI